MLHMLSQIFALAFTDGATPSTGDSEDVSKDVSITTSFGTKIYTTIFK